VEKPADSALSAFCQSLAGNTDVCAGKAKQVRTMAINRRGNMSHIIVEAYPCDGRFSSILNRYILRLPQIPGIKGD